MYLLSNITYRYQMYYKVLLLSIICLSVNVVSNSQSLTPAFSDVDHVGNNNVKQKMDIYIPEGLTSPAPVIVFIHGGGWLEGSKGSENIPFFQQSYNSGFICADINYRLSTDSIWPAQIEDCKTAIRFLKANAALYNVDTCNFGVIGESAGGHLASMIGTSAGVKSLEGYHLGHRNQTSRVKAVVDLYGPTDFLKEDGYYPPSCGSSVIHNFNSFETKLLGVDYLTSYPDLVGKANPITYITADDARFFIIHGADDCVVPSYQSTLLNSALSAARIPADNFIIAEGRGHGGPYFKDSSITTLFNEFFLAHLLTPCIISSGISESIFRNVSVYPNPATDKINVDLQVTDNFAVEIINTNGISVITVRNQNTIDISGLRSGVYFLKLSSSDGTYTQKLIKH
jgi:acetyl esterase/lipase